MKKSERHSSWWVYAVTGLLWSAMSFGSDELRSVAIPPGELGRALVAFARQMRVDVLYRSDQVKGSRTAGVHGTMTAREAVERLLDGTEFRIHQDSSGAIVVVLPSEGAAQVVSTKPILLAQTDGRSPSDVIAPSAEPPEMEEVVVVGTHIRGIDVGDVLPVTVLDQRDISATGATTGDELLRALPQSGAVAFNEQRTTGGINDARGDVASVNLRALGTGNTLVLLNGRRLVLHPGTQAENLVPVTSVNANAIPVMGIERMEVLRDGASALYGTDAIAGVINTVLRTDFEGFTGELQYGGSEGTALRELSASGQLGLQFNEDRSNFSLFVSHYDREGMPASDRSYSASSDMRALVVGTPFEDDTDFDNRSTSTPWGVFQTSGFGRVTRNGAALTSTTGQFHVQPDINEGCRVAVGTGICIDDGALSATTDRNLRYDVNAPRSLASDGRRSNAFAFFNHRFDGGLEFFSELGYYEAQTVAQREQTSPLSSARITVPASNYYNPFGAVTLPDGSANPNRLSGLNVPVTGVPLTITGYRPVDVDPRRIVVDDDSYRALAGLRHSFGSWDLESAALYSEAQTVDRTHNGISNTLFQQTLAAATPAAYNPFNGGDLTNLTAGDATRSDATGIDSFLVEVYRDSQTSLALWDAKLSNSRLAALPGGDLGIAFGVEWRRESFSDDRDPRLDGTITYTNSVTGEVSGSDVMGSSPTPDTSGHRHVNSAFVEFAVPVFQNFDVQLAARFEDYSDVGDVLKPRIAFGWQMADWLRLRGAWSEGFRAPNLPQVFERGVERVNTRADYVRCEADIRAGRIADFDSCSSSQQVASLRSGSRDLRPEDDENISAGIVLTPTIAPGLTVSADYWRVEQTRVVGIFGDANHIALDYLLRTRGSSNPNVLRAAPDQDDIDAFAGTGLDPVGDIVSVIDNYTNLLPRTIEGMDFGIHYRLSNTRTGDWRVAINAARLLTFFQDPSSGAAEILAAQESGEISSGFTVAGAENLMQREGRPKWRGSVGLGWNKSSLSAGLFGSYVGEVVDENATLTDGTPFPIDEWFTVNLYGQYAITSGWLKDTTFRLGVRNIADEEPPLADESFGYLGELHSNRGRYWYMNLRHKF